MLCFCRIDLINIYLDAGMVFDRIVLTGITFAQYLVHHFTAIATKILVVEYNRIGAAIFTTVKARYGRRFCHIKANKVMRFVGMIDVISA